MSAKSCMLCGEAEHTTHRCPTLFSPLKEGFYSPPAGHRPSGDDEDDERLYLNRCVGVPKSPSAVMPSQCLDLSLALPIITTGGFSLSDSSSRKCSLLNISYGTI